MIKKTFKKYLLILIIVSITFTGCNKNKSIVIYSAMEEERNKALETKVKEKFSDVNVIVQHIGTGNIAAKLKIEKTNIEADIILDLETSHLEKLKDNLEDLSNFNKDTRIEGVDSSNKYLTWTKYSVGLIIDNQYFKKHNLSIPKTYDDLLNPQYKNIIAMPDPTSSGSGYAFLLNLVNLKGEEDAIKYLKKLKNNIREFTTSGSGPTNLLKQGEVAIAMGMYSQGVSAINEGYDFSLIELSTGCPYNTTSSAIIKGRGNKEKVKEIFQWLISDYSKYDIETFMPAEIFKEQRLKIKNYPSDIKQADMTGIENSELKDKLLKRWEEVNG